MSVPATQASLVGLKLDFARWTKPEPPCRRCGSFRAVVTHSTELACANCLLPRGKLPAHVADFLAASITHFFKPDDDIRGVRVAIGDSTFDPRTSVDAPKATGREEGLRGARAFHNDNKQNGGDLK